MKKINKRFTHKKFLLLKALPKHDFNISHSYKEAGYKSLTAACNAVRGLNIFGTKGSSRIKQEIEEAIEDFKENKDNTNRSRMLELASKIEGLYKDGGLVINQQFNFTEEEEKEYKELKDRIK
jgi:hypothetical protein